MLKWLQERHESDLVLQGINWHFGVETDLFSLQCTRESRYHQAITRQYLNGRPAAQYE